jgi:hypothetical protein
MIDFSHPTGSTTQVLALCLALDVTGSASGGRAGGPLLGGAVGTMREPLRYRSGHEDDELGKNPRWYRCRPDPESDGVD